MKEPFYEEGHQLFECPTCRASYVKYRYDFEPNGNLIHWAECDFSMCHSHHELHYPGELPKDPISLLVIEEEPQLTNDAIVAAEVKIEFFHKIIESDKKDFKNMSQEDLIYYIICMDHFLQAKREFDATLYMRMRFGKRG